jgi:hypothetical protein
MSISIYRAVWWTKRPFRLLRKRIRVLIRNARYGRMPSAGWGCGWRVLVFRYLDPPRDELHVLAPVSGDEFDWELLRVFVRGEPWPAYEQEPGKLVGVMGWAGHHTFVTDLTDGRPQRLSMGKLVLGEFGGGADRSLRLIAVREAKLK